LSTDNEEEVSIVTREKIGKINLKPLSTENVVCLGDKNVNKQQWFSGKIIGGK